MVINKPSNFLSFQLIPSIVDDRKPVSFLLGDLFGNVFADKDYISKKLFVELLQENIQLITGLCKNIDNKLMEIEDKLFLRKHSIIETINDQLRNISQIEASKHCCFTNFPVNLVAGSTTYALKPTKLALNLKEALPAIVCYT